MDLLMWNQYNNVDESTLKQPPVAWQPNIFDLSKTKGYIIVPLPKKEFDILGLAFIFFLDKS